MQCLQAMGMRLSEKLIPASVENPDGYFEDADIVALHRRYMTQLRLRPSQPVTNSMRKKLIAPPLPGEIAALLEERISAAPGIWGFKDPRTSLFLPAWEQAFRQHRVVPLYIFCIRDPHAVLGSLSRIKPQDTKDNREMMFLARMYNTLSVTSGNCFLVHYEDWFTDPLGQAAALLRYTGLDATFAGDLADITRGIVKPQYNIAAHLPETVDNAWLLQLNEELKECRHADWDASGVMRVIAALKSEIDCWTAAPVLTAEDKHGEQVKQLEADNKQLVLMNNTSLQEMLALKEKLKELQIKIARQAKDAAPQQAKDAAPQQAKNSFPNAPQRFLLYFYSPVLKSVDMESWRRFRCDPADFFARTKDWRNKFLLFFLRVVGPRPQKGNRIS
jgi:hypothetical protein